MRGPPVERAAELALAALQNRRRRRAHARRARRLGHQVEIEELDDFELDVARGGAGFEEGCDGQQAVDGFEGARVGGCGEEGGDEDEEGVGLDCGTVCWVEEVQEELFPGLAWMFLGCNSGELSALTSMYISWMKSAREGGCRRRTPCSRSSVESMSKSCAPPVLSSSQQGEHHQPC